MVDAPVDEALSSHNNADQVQDHPYTVGDEDDGIEDHEDDNDAAGTMEVQDDSRHVDVVTVETQWPAGLQLEDVVCELRLFVNRQIDETKLETPSLGCCCYCHVATLWNWRKKDYTEDVVMSLPAALQSPQVTVKIKHETLKEIGRAHV